MKTIMAQDWKEKGLTGAFITLERAIKHPEKFIGAREEDEPAVTSCTKTIFDLAARHAEERLDQSNPLGELITEGFDEEQIWQELELHNQPCIKTVVGNIARLIAGQNRLSLAEVPRERTMEDNESSDDDGDDDDEEKDEEEEEKEDGDDSDVEDDDDSLNIKTRPSMSKKKKVDQGSDVSEADSDTNFSIDDSPSRTKRCVKQTASQGSAVEDKSGKRSVVDDDFFKLEDMESFLDMEDAKEAKRVRRMEQGDMDEKDADDDDDDDDLDFFQDIPSDEDDYDDDDDEKNTRQMMYSDFFDPPGSDAAKPVRGRKKQVHFDEEEEEEAEEGEDEGDEGSEVEEGSHKDFDEESFEDADDEVLADLRKMAGGGNKDDLLLSNSESEGEDVEDILGGGKKKSDGEKSSFERRQEKLKQRIGELEKSNLSEKSWQLIGEVGGAKRPENSLLEENLEFDVMTKPAPVATEETTQTLEGLIKQRILDQAWDDVQRKSKPKEEVQEFKKRVTLDQEKSKMSLGEIYEQEYIKQTQQEAEEEKEDPLHTEIKESMDSLFIKLDALSNFHFTPKPIVPEVKIVANTPAISMEEVTPINVASSSLLAPEEIQEKEKRELKGKTEKTRTDLKRELREKKARQRAKAREREKRERLVEKLKPGLGNKYSKKAALAKLEKNSKAPSSNTTVIKDSGKATTSLKSSQAFFSKLQDEVTSHVHGLKENRKKKRKEVSGTQLKL